MGKKYIIELESGTHIFVLGPEGIVHIGEPDVVYETVDGMQIGDAVINAKPYTEPDLERVRVEAYEEGYKTAKIQCGIQAEKDMREVGERHYQRGLSDAWKAVRKIADMPYGDGKKIFGVSGWHIIEKCTADEVIAEIKALEESEESKKEQSVVDEDAMRQYLDEFCHNTKRCVVCPLHTPDFTCGRGRHFFTDNPVPDEEVRRAYAKVVKEK